MLGWAAEMSGDPKDPAIKLFGKTIPLPEIPPEAAVADSNQIHETGSPPEDSERADTEPEEREDDKEPSKINPTASQEEDEGQCPTGEDAIDPDAASGISEKNRTSSVDEESATQKASKSEEEQSETSNSQEKPLKKPAKILPCPRCNSMDTKFCYYNNYNVNQPRHFCKNCQRYWTAGGTMRNVPVGAGRRKNKSLTSQYHRHVTVSEAFQNVRIDIPNGGLTVHHGRPNGTVFAIGSSEAPLCKSMTSALNLAGKTTRGSPRNGFHKPDGVIVPGTCSDKLLEPPNRSPATGPNTKDSEGGNGAGSGYIPQVHCYPGAPWPYPWSLGQWGLALPPALPYCPTGFVVPFFPPAAAYWGCSVPGAWSVPWVPGPSSPVTSGSGSGPNSPTLGKHSRDEQNAPKESRIAGENDGSAKEASAERCLWIPKTLRIDDPGEAAKSSIWATLGIKNDKVEPVNGGGLFKAFQSKVVERNHSSEASPVLKANPAALSRSVNFHESS